LGNQTAQPSQWCEDVKSYFKRRQAKDTPDVALKGVLESAEQLEKAEELPRRVPQPPRGSGRLGKVMLIASKFGRVTSSLGIVVSGLRDLPQIFAQRFVGEGRGIELDYSDPEIPFFRRPSGYTIEKRGRKIIYRDPNGDQILKKKRIRH
jgi:hypothetical protein